ncbi:hypothetical protein EIP91_005377 [Steccherinum ochraceum]|uniref:Uncharacterized protein n=1 Tax=Steccherinum ochraceum TaxID=92696 RepID=A0A4R0RI77_9APHY|nr:hypothetical protein EIP91_005377 [Steccherinum ochraceum]
MRFSTVSAITFVVAAVSVAAVPFADVGAQSLIARNEYAHALRNREALDDRPLAPRDLLKSIYSRDLNHRIERRNFKRTPTTETGRPRSGSTDSTASTLVGEGNEEPSEPPPAEGRRLSGATVNNEPGTSTDAQAPSTGGGQPPRPGGGPLTSHPVGPQ